MFNKKNSIGSASSRKSLHGTSQIIEACPKPVNLFYIWYTELCRRMNLTPLNIVKPAKVKNETVLDFVTDRIKPEEWTPIISALKLDTSLHVLCIRSKLRCKFMDDITTEEKVKGMKRRAGSIWTPYILRILVNSISYSLRRTTVLTFLELDGLPVMAEYLETLLESIKKNTTLKVLSLKHCPIRDLGCEKVCQALRLVPNIETINLSSCLLGSVSAQYISKLIRYQQINRYCESWHSSLRYTDPQIGIMAGLKRVTLNNNPNIGDEGLLFILNELDDDLWIKALDMQKCNITNDIANRLIDIVEYNRSIEIADFRNNELLSTATIQRILDILKSKQRLGDTEYQWCMTPSTLPCQSSVMDTTTSHLIRQNQAQKSKSTQFNKCSDSKKSDYSLGLRRMKTSICIPLNNKERLPICRFATLADAKKEVLQLNAQLQKEIFKRQKTEEENRQLKSEIFAIKSSTLLFQTKNNSLKRTNSNLSMRRPLLLSKQPTSKQCQSVNTKEFKNDLNSINKECQNKKSVEFVFGLNDKNKSAAQNLFHNLLYQNNLSTDETDRTASDIEFEEYVEESTPSTSPIESSETESIHSESNASLIEFMEEIKLDSKSKPVRPKVNCWNMKTKRKVHNGFGIIS